MRTPDAKVEATSTADLLVEELSRSSCPWHGPGQTGHISRARAQRRAGTPITDERLRKDSGGLPGMVYVLVRCEGSGDFFS